MTPDTRDHAIPGRRSEDGGVVINPRRLGRWVTLAISCIVLVTLVWNALAGQVVRPRALQAVADSVGHVADQQDTFSAIQTRQNARITDVESRLTQMQVVLEIVAVQACRNLRSDPYAYRKAQCAEYLETK